MTTLNRVEVCLATPRKIKFDTAADAEEHLTLQRRRLGRDYHPCRVYPCGACGYFHVQDIAKARRRERRRGR